MTNTYKDKPWATRMHSAAVQNWKKSTQRWVSSPEEDTESKPTTPKPAMTCTDNITSVKPQGGEQWPTPWTTHRHSAAVQNWKNNVQSWVSSSEEDVEPKPTIELKPAMTSTDKITSVKPQGGAQWPMPWATQRHSTAVQNWKAGKQRWVSSLGTS